MEPIIPILGFSVWIVAKLLFLFALLIYIIFSLVVVRQVNLMTETLEVGFESPLKTAAGAHLLLAIGVFILALIIL
ncbi:hypothetical protein IID21_03435 [Patescibacteria group bacterium]|nr:hypothetical protein [Patescibacteria group bacterium]